MSPNSSTLSKYQQERASVIDNNESRELTQGLNKLAAPTEGKTEAQSPAHVYRTVGLKGEKR